jgi:hypothetical protein
MNRGVMYGLTAAALFGASTPFAKAILNDVHPIVLAGLLYAGSGLGLIAGRQYALPLDRKRPPLRCRRAEIGFGSLWQSWSEESLVRYC